MRVAYHEHRTHVVHTQRPGRQLISVQCLSPSLDLGAEKLCIKVYLVEADLCSIGILAAPTQYGYN